MKSNIHRLVFAVKIAVGGFMNLKYLQIEKVKKIGKFKKLKKRDLLILLIVLLILLAVAGGAISRGVFKEKAPEGKKIESVQKDQSKENEKTEASIPGDLENHLASDFIKTLKSGKYLIRYKTTTVYEGKSFEVETTYAVSGDSIAMVSADRATIVKDNKVYMLNHTDKTILSWAVDPASENLKRIDTDGIAYQGNSKEGNLVCEEYTTALTHLKLYFSGKELVRMATIINGLDVVMDIAEVSNEVPESLFEVPSEYRTTNI
jgi:hypothetical protein